MENPGNANARPSHGACRYVCMELRCRERFFLVVPFGEPSPGKRGIEALALASTHGLPRFRYSGPWYCSVCTVHTLTIAWWGGLSGVGAPCFGALVGTQYASSRFLATVTQRRTFAIVVCMQMMRVWPNNPHHHLVRLHLGLASVYRWVATASPGFMFHRVPDSKAFSYMNPPGSRHRIDTWAFGLRISPTQLQPVFCIASLAYAVRQFFFSWMLLDCLNT